MYLQWNSCMLENKVEEAQKTFFAGDSPEYGRDYIGLHFSKLFRSD